MNLERRVAQLEKTYRDAKKAWRPLDFRLTAQEHAALCLSATPLLASYDAEYAPRAKLFNRRCNKPRQTDPAEMMKALRNTVHGDEAEIAAERQRYRALMDSVFERCGFDFSV